LIYLDLGEYVEMGKCGNGVVGQIVDVQQNGVVVVKSAPASLYSYELPLPRCAQEQQEAVLSQLHANWVSYFYFCSCCFSDVLTGYSPCKCGEKNKSEIALYSMFGESGGYGTSMKSQERHLRVGLNRVNSNWRSLAVDQVVGAYAPRISRG
jgi:hypothetical protein